MIGQTGLIKQIQMMIEQNSFPRFSIIVGEKGSGKKTLARLIRSRFQDALFADVGMGVEAVRDIISNAYKVVRPIIYLIGDADNMSLQAKNALLKIAEEPPNNAYIIMTLEDLSNTLETIKSRAIVFYMDRYTPEQLRQYAQEQYQDNIELYGDICSTPGEVDLLYRMGAEDFYHYAEKVVDNIATVNGSNVFKIVDKIAMKDEPDKYDLKMFLKTFSYICAKRSEWLAVVRTSSALQKLGIKGVNKQMLFDEWILEVRKVWM